MMLSSILNVEDTLVTPCSMQSPSNSLVHEPSEHVSTPNPGRVLCPKKTARKGVNPPRKPTGPITITQRSTTANSFLHQPAHLNQSSSPISNQTPWTVRTAADSTRLISEEHPEKGSPNIEAQSIENGPNSNGPSLSDAQNQFGNFSLRPIVSTEVRPDKMTHKNIQLPGNNNFRPSSATHDVVLGTMTSSQDVQQINGKKGNPRDQNEGAAGSVVTMTPGRSPPIELAHGYSQASVHQSPYSDSAINKTTANSHESFHQYGNQLFFPQRAQAASFASQSHSGQNLPSVHSSAAQPSDSHSISQSKASDLTLQPSTDTFLGATLPGNDATWNMIDGTMRSQHNRKPPQSIANSRLPESTSPRASDRWPPTGAGPHPTNPNPAETRNQSMRDHFRASRISEPSRPAAGDRVAPRAKSRRHVLQTYGMNKSRRYGPRIYGMTEPLRGINPKQTSSRKWTAEAHNLEVIDLTGDDDNSRVSQEHPRAELMSWTALSPSASSSDTEFPSLQDMSQGLKPEAPQAVAESPEDSTDTTSYPRQHPHKSLGSSILRQREGAVGQIPSGSTYNQGVVEWIREHSKDNKFRNLTPESLGRESQREAFQKELTHSSSGTIRPVPDRSSKNHCTPEVKGAPAVENHSHFTDNRIGSCIANEPGTQTSIETIKSPSIDQLHQPQRSISLESKDKLAEHVSDHPITVPAQLDVSPPQPASFSLDAFNPTSSETPLDSTSFPSFWVGERSHAAVPSRQLLLGDERRSLHIEQSEAFPNDPGNLESINPNNGASPVNADKSYIPSQSRRALTRQERRHEIRKKTFVLHGEDKFDKYIQGSANAHNRPSSIEHSPLLKSAQSDMQWAYIDPRVHWTWPRTDEWHENKQKNISSRAHRKAVPVEKAEKGLRKYSIKAKKTMINETAITRKDPVWLAGQAEMDQMAAAYHAKKKERTMLKGKGKEITTEIHCDDNDDDDVLMDDA